MTAPGSGAVNGFAGPAVTSAPSCPQCHHCRARKSREFKEIQALLAVIEWSTAPAAAHALGISQGAIVRRLTHLYRRLGVADRTEAAVKLYPVLGPFMRIRHTHEWWEAEAVSGGAA